MVQIAQCNARRAHARVVGAAVCLVEGPITVAQQYRDVVPAVVRHNHIEIAIAVHVSQPYSPWTVEGIGNRFCKVHIAWLGRGGRVGDGRPTGVQRDR